MKLMLVDDHPLFLEGLQYLLETYGIRVASIAHNGQEAISKAREIKPDIILMDIKMKKCSGIDALKCIKAEMPGIKIVMLTTSEEDDDLIEAKKYGASGYLLKNMNAKELVDTLSDLAPNLLRKYKTKIPRTESENKLGLLTERQLKVLRLVARGITYKEVGDSLDLSERTVKYHMGKIIEKLHYENKAQVITYAARMGLIAEEESKQE